MIERLNQFTFREFVVLFLLVVCGYLAVIDTSYREVFGDLAKVGLGGYLAQLVPKSN